MVDAVICVCYGQHQLVMDWSQVVFVPLAYLYWMITRPVLLVSKLIYSDLIVLQFHYICNISQEFIIMYCSQYTMS